MWIDDLGRLRNASRTVRSSYPSFAAVVRYDERRSSGISTTPRLLLRAERRPIVTRAPRTRVSVSPSTTVTSTGCGCPFAFRFRGVRAGTSGTGSAVLTGWASVTGEAASRCEPHPAAGSPAAGRGSGGRLPPLWGPPPAGAG